MKKSSIFLAILLLNICRLNATPESREMEYQAAYYQEVGSLDLNGAVEKYSQLTAENDSIAAKAWQRIIICYDQLNLPEEAEIAAQKFLDSQTGFVKITDPVVRKYLNKIQVQQKISNEKEIVPENFITQTHPLKREEKIIKMEKSVTSPSQFVKDLKTEKAFQMQQFEWIGVPYIYFRFEIETDGRITISAIEGRKNMEQSAIPKFKNSLFLKMVQGDCQFVMDENGNPLKVEGQNRFDLQLKKPCPPKEYSRLFFRDKKKLSQRFLFKDGDELLFYLADYPGKLANEQEIHTLVEIILPSGSSVMQAFIPRNFNDVYNSISNFFQVKTGKKLILTREARLSNRLTLRFFVPNFDFPIADLIDFQQLSKLALVSQDFLFPFNEENIWEAAARKMGKARIDQLSYIQIGTQKYPSNQLTQNHRKKNKDYGLRRIELNENGDFKGAGSHQWVNHKDDPVDEIKFTAQTDIIEKFETSGKKIKQTKTENVERKERPLKNFPYSETVYTLTLSSKIVSRDSISIFYTYKDQTDKLLFCYEKDEIIFVMQGLRYIYEEEYVELILPANSEIIKTFGPVTGIQQTNNHQILTWSRPMHALGIPRKNLTIARFRIPNFDPRQTDWPKYAEVFAKQKHRTKITSNFKEIDNITFEFITSKAMSEEDLMSTSKKLEIIKKRKIRGVSVLTNVPDEYREEVLKRKNYIPLGTQFKYSVAYEAKPLHKWRQWYKFSMLSWGDFGPTEYEYEITFSPEVELMSQNYVAPLPVKLDTVNGMQVLTLRGMIANTDLGGGNFFIQKKE